MALMLNGRPVAQQVEAELVRKIQQLEHRLKLGILLVGDNPESINYINRKKKLAERIGVDVALHHLPANATLGVLVDQIEAWNSDSSISGLIVQLPLPGHLSSSLALEKICPYKDIDGINPWSLGKLLEGEPMLVSATAQGIVKLLNYYHIPIAGQRVVVVGRSPLVGRPIAMLMVANDATVTIAHRQTKDLAEVTQQADIIITAAGQPGLLKQGHIKPGAVVIDVGLTSTADGLRGDVERSEVEPIARALSPVPGGVGPLTVACLFDNLYQAYAIQQRSGHQHDRGNHTA